MGLGTLAGENFLRTHGYAKGRDNLAEPMNKPLVKLEEILGISGDGVDI